MSVRTIVLASREYGSVDVREALGYYEAHRAEIDEYIAANLSDD